MSTNALKRILLLVVVGAIQLGLWMAYVDNPSRAEWIIGSIAAIFASGAAYATVRVAHFRFRPTFRMLIQGWRIPWNVLSETWDLAVATYRQFFHLVHRSRITAVPFRYGTHGGHDVARRMLAAFYSTLTPNTVVIGFVCEQNVLLHHQMVSRDASPILASLREAP
jgi:multisubunit Na+/H+ antiporter MnhE subunit